MTQRLDKLVAERFGLSRRQAQEAVLTGRIDLEGTPCDEPGRLVPVEAVLHYHPHRPKSRRVVGRAAIQSLYEDQHILIVNKPAGIPTLPSFDYEQDTLRNRVEKYLKLRYGGRPYVGIIHRLDKDTSGALAFARTPEALAVFQNLFRLHAAERRYLAIVEGVPSRAQGTIDRDIDTETGSVRRRLAGPHGQGKRAVTHYELLEPYGRVASLIACWLETGRTHQIRLHLAAIGHPVLGDRVYRPRNQPRCKARFHRQALHAQTLAFRHPISNVDVRVEAALPADCSALIADLRNRFGLKGAGG